MPDEVETVSAGDTAPERSAAAPLGTPSVDDACRIDDDLTPPGLMLGRLMAELPARTLEPIADRPSSRSERVCRRKASVNALLEIPPAGKHESAAVMDATTVENTGVERREAGVAGPRADG